jgi:heme/copper-type cytochrome/quinol oxidase subunit 2
VQSKIASAYKMLGKYDKESLYLKESSNMLKLNVEKDKIHLQRELQNIQKDYNNEKGRDKIQNSIILIFIILSYVFVLLFLFKYRKIKNKKKDY